MRASFRGATLMRLTNYTATACPLAPVCLLWLTDRFPLTLVLAFIGPEADNSRLGYQALFVGVVEVTGGILLKSVEYSAMEFAIDFVFSKNASNARFAIVSPA